MNVAILGDCYASVITSMTQVISQINWTLIKNADQDQVNTFDYKIYVISPISTKHQGIPQCLPMLIDDANKCPRQTFFYFLNEDEGLSWSRHQQKSLQAIGKMITENGAIWLKSLPESEQGWMNCLAG